MTFQRFATQALSFVLAAVVTTAMLAGIDGLAGRDAAPAGALLVLQQPASTGG